jgi:hypothetical protein
MRCANCSGYLSERDCTGDSSLYNHGDGIGYMLCEPCFLEEDELIDEKGTNDIPDRRAHYERNQPGGYR